MGLVQLILNVISARKHVKIETGEGAKHVDEVSEDSMCWIVDTKKQRKKPEKMHRY